MIHAGEATNVVPDCCEIQGTVRTFTTEVLDLIERRMKVIAESTCAAFEAGCEFEFKRNYPPTVNHAAETEFARQLLGEVVGAENVLEFEPTMGSEDFSYFLQAKPGCYFLIGNGDGAHREGGHGLGPCMLHNPSYDFNDELIPLGATAWVRLAEKWLARRADEGRAMKRRHVLRAELRRGARKFLGRRQAAGLDAGGAPAPAARPRRRVAGHGRGALRRGRRAGAADHQQCLPWCRGLLRLGRAERAAGRRRPCMPRPHAPAWPCSTSTRSTPTASRGCAAPRTRTST